jgi:hypothetical protein
MSTNGSFSRRHRSLVVGLTKFRGECRERRAIALFIRRERLERRMRWRRGRGGATGSAIGRESSHGRRGRRSENTRRSSRHRCRSGSWERYRAGGPRSIVFRGDRGSERDGRRWNDRSSLFIGCRGRETIKRMRSCGSNCLGGLFHMLGGRGQTSKHASLFAWRCQSLVDDGDRWSCPESDRSAGFGRTIISTELSSKTH